MPIRSSRTAASTRPLSKRPGRAVGIGVGCEATGPRGRSEELRRSEESAAEPFGERSSAIPVRASVRPIATGGRRRRWPVGGRLGPRVAPLGGTVGGAGGPIGRALLRTVLLRRLPTRLLTVVLLTTVLLTTVR